jgi:hypothetical protein
MQAVAYAPGPQRADGAFLPPAIVGRGAISYSVHLSCHPASREGL